MDAANPEVEAVTQAPRVPDPKRMELVFNALSTRVNAEIVAYWSRNNVMLAVNAGLLAVGFNQHNDYPTAFALGVVGVITAIIWLLVAVRGRVWLRYWERRLIQLEDSLPAPAMYEEPFWRLELREATKKGRPKSVTSLILPIPLFMIAAWLVLIVSVVAACGQAT